MTDEENKKRSRERYYWLKSKGICVQCGCEKAEKKSVFCLECRANRRESQRNRYSNNPEIREKRNQYSMVNNPKRYAECIEKGLCVQCGKRPVKEGHRMCGICLAKHRKSSEEYRRKKGIMPRFLMGNGEYCYFCGKPGCNGRKTCEECRERQAAVLAKARLSISTEDHIWRKMETARYSEIRQKKGSEENEQKY